MLEYDSYGYLGKNRIAECAHKQARNQGGPEDSKPPLENFSPPWKNVFGMIQNYWTQLKDLGPLRKLFAPPGVPRWVRACPQV